MEQRLNGVVASRKVFFHYKTILKFPSDIIACLPTNRESASETEREKERGRETLPAIFSIIRDRLRLRAICAH